MGFLDRVFGRQEPSSSSVAKERLKLVLVHDRVKLSAAALDEMKDELIKVISRYVEIDPSGVEVTFSQSRHESRLTADIPVIGPVERTRAAQADTNPARTPASARSRRDG